MAYDILVGFLIIPQFPASRSSLMRHQADIFVVYLCFFKAIKSVFMYITPHHSRGEFVMWFMLFRVECKLRPTVCKLNVLTARLPGFQVYEDSMQVTYCPLSKLFLLLSNFFSPESPSSPNMVMRTFASVPAPHLFPV